VTIAMADDYRSTVSPHFTYPSVLTPNRASSAGPISLLSKPTGGVPDRPFWHFVIVFFAMQVAAPDSRKSSMSSHCGGLTAGSPRAKSHFSVKCLTGCLLLDTSTSGMCPTGTNHQHFRGGRARIPPLWTPVRPPVWPLSRYRPTGGDATGGETGQRPTAATAHERTRQGYEATTAGSGMGGKWARPEVGTALTTAILRPDSHGTANLSPGPPPRPGLRVRCNRQPPEPSALREKASSPFRALAREISTMVTRPAES
jgi:hypothetical protein